MKSNHGAAKTASAKQRRLLAPVGVSMASVGRRKIHRVPNSLIAASTHRARAASHALGRFAFIYNGEV